MRKTVPVLALVVMSLLVVVAAAYYLTSRDTSECSDPDSISSHIYNPDRLDVIKSCTTASGFVDNVLKEADGDYHLVLASPRDTTITIIAEVPDPACAGACASGFAQIYAQVRQKLIDYLNSAQSEARPLVRITGVGFFDYLHGQRGVAPNGIELHPVLDVDFR